MPESLNQRKRTNIEESGIHLKLDIVRWDTQIFSSLEVSELVLKFVAQLNELQLRDSRSDL
jgi:hypothetical protein